MKREQKIGVINTYGANLAALHSPLGNGDKRYFHPSGLKTRVTPPIPTSAFKNVRILGANNEITQKVLIGSEALGAYPIVPTAATKYSLQIAIPGKKDETGYRPPYPYSYTSPDPCTGATGIEAIINGLKAKINAYAGNDVVAKHVYKLAFTIGTQVTGVTGTTTDSPIVDAYEFDTSGAPSIPATFQKVVAGQGIGTQETSSVTCKIAACQITANDLSGVNGEGNIWIYDISDESAWLSSAKVLTIVDTITGESFSVSINLALEYKDALLIEDDANYHSVPGFGERKGASAIHLTAGFITAQTDTICKAIYSRGVGAKLKQLEPTFNRDKSDVLTGDVDYVVIGESIDITKYYITCVLEFDPGAYADGLHNAPMSFPHKVILYIQGNTTAAFEVLDTLATAFGDATLGAPITSVEGGNIQYT